MSETLWSSKIIRLLKVLFCTLIPAYDPGSKNILSLKTSTEKNKLQVLVLKSGA